MAQSDWLFAQEGKNLISCFLTGTDRWEEPAIFFVFFGSFPDTQTSVKTKVKGETLSLQIHKLTKLFGLVQ